MIFWRPFLHEDTCYDLAHLHPFLHSFEQMEQGDRPARKYQVQVMSACIALPVLQMRRMIREGRWDMRIRARHAFSISAVTSDPGNCQKLCAHCQGRHASTHNMAISSR